MSYFSALPEMPAMDNETGRFAYDRLQRAFLSTALIDPRREIATPGDAAENASILELVMRDLNGPHGPDLLASIIRVLATTSQGVQIIAWLAGDYGQRHWAAKVAQDALAAACRAEVEREQVREHDAAEPRLEWPE